MAVVVVVVVLVEVFLVVAGEMVALGLSSRIRIDCKVLKSTI